MSGAWPARVAALRRDALVFFILLSAVVTPAVVTPAAARDLTLAAPDEPLVAQLAKNYVAAFAQQSGIAMVEAPFDGSIEAITLAAGAHTPWDIVLLAAPVLREGCARGLLQKLDWNAIGGRERYLPEAVSECGVGAFLKTMVLSWDNDKIQGAPSWADFWDVAKYPGKRGLRRDPRMTLEFALLADGVAPGDVYATLRTSEGLKRAFRKLDQLRPYLVWWQKDDEAARQLGEGKVLMTMAPSEEIVAADRDGAHHFGMQWNGSLYRIKSFALIAGTPLLDPTRKFLAFIGDPALEARLMTDLAFGPLAKGASALLPPPLRALSPSSPGNLKDALPFDEGFWEENEAALRQRFDAWLAQH